MQTVPEDGCSVPSGERWNLHDRARRKWNHIHPEKLYVKGKKCCSQKNLLKKYIWLISKSFLKDKHKKIFRPWVILPKETKDIISRVTTLLHSYAMHSLNTYNKCVILYSVHYNGWLPATPTSHDDFR